MQLLNTQIGDIGQVIEIASRNPLAAIVAPIVLAWVVGYSYFAKGRSQKNGRLLKYRFATFVLALLGSLAAGRLVVSLERVVTYADGALATRQPLQIRQKGNRLEEPDRSAKNKADSSTIREFASQIEQARKYSRLTDFTRACEIYSSALGSLPIVALSNMEHETVSAEAKKCGKGQSQEAVGSLEGIAMRLTVN